MEVLYPRCAGLDVHKDTVVACRRAVDDVETRQEVRTFRTTTRGLLSLREWLEAWGCTHVVMESTGVYWKPVWHALEPADEEDPGKLACILANPAHVRNVPGRKSDVSDAQWLAELLAHGLVAPSFVPERATQQMRDLTRTHTQLTRELARHVQRIQKALEDADIKLTGLLADLTGASGMAILKALVAGERDPEVLAGMALGRAKRKHDDLVEALSGHFREHHAFLVGLHLAQVESIQEALGAVEERLNEALEPLRHKERLLCTIHGIGPTSAPVVLAEIGPDMTRFPSVGHLISWAGFCPKLDQSAGKRKNTTVKKGAPWLKTMLVQCAWAAITVKGSYLRSRYLRLRARRGAKKAIVAVAADILRAAYFILKRDVPYQDLGGDYYDRLDTTKATRSLVKRLQSLGFDVALTKAS
jgi:transposase